MPDGTVGVCGTSATRCARSRRVSVPIRARVEFDKTRCRRQAGDRSQQRALPGAVRPDDAQPLARLDLESTRRSIAHAPTDADAEADAPHRRAHGEVRDERKTMRKNGAPKNAVTTPIGSSAGEITIRARRSANARKAAPKSSESGRIDR